MKEALDEIDWDVEMVEGQEQDVHQMEVVMKIF
jgi:hypothetical protein